MEFPDLGKHCSEPSCKQLDFLPVKCDACENIYCHEHMKYASHNCESLYKKNVQVPVCPLCNIPIPFARGQPPDVAVSAHIDTQCQSDPAKDRRKTYTNKCSMKGCKVKELIPCICKECRLNFCLKHRHTTDHLCIGSENARRQKSLMAAMNRRENTNGTVNSSAITSIQGTLSEDEALAKALQLSMQDTNGSSSEHDRALAWALSQSQNGESESRSRRI
ncbi:AN1-type zinc finger protein 2A isoform X2 [Lycorma delicatula]|uniref:AN1-type zinc finger protein 2A isoform X2 n=1 Tax=Lycorma delicatula TaxID=130591 RepID=UPI003F517CA6